MSEAEAMSLNTASPLIALSLRPCTRVEFAGCFAMIERVLDSDAMLLRPVGSKMPRTSSATASEIRTLPRSTFSNPTARGGYDCAGRVALALSDFEQWLTTLIFLSTRSCPLLAQAPAASGEGALCS
jgi:hypothetical protein